MTDKVAAPPRVPAIPPQDLRDRWERFVSGASASPAVVDNAFADLARHYGEPHRAYHNLSHLQQCFRELDRAVADPRTSVTDPDAVELAIWFHDVIYEPLSSHNEAKSAALAVEVGAMIGLAPSTVASAERMIIATKAHAITSDPDRRLMLDCDLSILGQSGAAFAQYQRDVRREYRWIPDWYYARRRRAFLLAMLERPTIFQTASFIDLYEAQARDNLRLAARDLAPAERRRQKVLFDARHLWTTQAGALRDRAAWDRIEKVTIVTTAGGPWEDDVIWIVSGRDEGVIVGSMDEGIKPLVDYLVKLPGFNHGAMIDAMGSTSPQRFTVWEREPSSADANALNPTST